MDQILELLRSVLPGMWRHRWAALMISSSIGVIGGAVALLIPNSYEATSRVFVDTQSILKPLMVGLAIQPNVEQQVGMMARTMVNRPNIDRVARISGLDQQIPAGKDRDGLIDRLTRDIRFISAGTTNLYAIAYRNEDPEDARKVVQALLDIFVESNLGDKQRDGEQAKRFIEEQIAGYEKRLQEAEGVLRDFKIRNLATMPGAQQDFVSSAREARMELEQARSELRQAESARDALRREVALELPTSAMSEVAPSAEPPRVTETDVRLQGARKRMDELQVQYTNAHPDVVGLRHIINQLEAQKREEAKADAQRKPSGRAPSLGFGGAEGAYHVIRASLAAAEAQVASLRSRVNTAQAKVTASLKAAETVPKVEAELAQLNRDYEINKTNYVQLLARRESAQMAGDMQTSAGVAQFRIVDPPRVAPQPASPNRALILGIALVVSLAAGAGYAFIREQIRPAFFTMRGLREATELPSLGAVTMIESPEIRRQKLLGVLGFSFSTAVYLGIFVLGMAYLTLRPYTHVTATVAGFLK